MKSLFTTLLILSTCNVFAVTTEWKLLDQHQKELKQFAMAFYPVGTTVSAVPSASAELIQKGKSFQPSHLVIRIGTTVSFPNKDDTAHSIYSFSQAKKFTVDLYKSTDKTPELLFDEEGVVILGCNIHDWMMGTIVVVNTPYYLFAAESAGSIDLPPGQYQIKAWHKDLNLEKLVELKNVVTVTAEPKQFFKMNVDIKPGDNW